MLRLCGLLLFDAISLCLALWCSFALRFSDLWPVSMLADGRWLFATLPLMSVAVIWQFGLYRTVMRHMDLRVLRSIGFAIAIICCIGYSTISIFQLENIPRSIPLIFGLCAWFFLSGSRIIFNLLVSRWITNTSKKQEVIIYGAGTAGVQFAQLCFEGNDYSPIAFVDDDKSLWNRDVLGLRVFPPDDLPKLLKRRSVGVLILALPSTSADVRNRIIQKFAGSDTLIKTMPTLPEIMSGESLSNIKEVPLESLLGRTVVDPLHQLLEKSVKEKNVCITGAGGSIGAELARQALMFGASTVVLYEQSEFFLYDAEQKLRNTLSLYNLDSKIVCILGSVQDEYRLYETLVRFKVSTLYHAAAYKHVPIVEENVLEGIKNNVFGTQSAALASEAAGVRRFILVSTDKAVRPTNVMGATKRLAELVLQDMAAKKSTQTVFSMVRFGNVLGSSGSVIPLFRRQINERSNITVTHPDITRFFMTIDEAASLVIQAGSMAVGGEVFVLDMGEPIKILDLAKTMVKSSGLSIKDEQNPNGDIEIEFTGLRQGEKLYEELLIDHNAEETAHPKILRASERKLTSAELEQYINELRDTVEKSEQRLAREVLRKAVKEYNPQKYIDVSPVDVIASR